MKTAIHIGNLNPDEVEKLKEKTKNLRSATIHSASWRIDNALEAFEKEACINLNGGDRLTWGDLEYYQEKGFEIIDGHEYLNDEKA